ncbi:uncharacterized protein LOC119094122 [Pollicipes pollicipes]|uniref:uncharacterized protein LOC119094122 n=1 Tax=Pollicipes pollicipes TaxID=41117 RepID=UPI001884E00E|nr:uncharacterized protein LOC119094122 [Pollicipes pollicipes]
MEDLSPPAHWSENLSPPAHWSENLSPPAHWIENLSPPAHWIENLPPPTHQIEDLLPPAHWIDRSRAFHGPPARRCPALPNAPMSCSSQWSTLRRRLALPNGHRCAGVLLFPMVNAALVYARNSGTAGKWRQGSPFHSAFMLLEVCAGLRLVNSALCCVHTVAVTALSHTVPSPLPCAVADQTVLTSPFVHTFPYPVVCGSVCIFFPVQEFSCTISHILSHSQMETLIGSLFRPAFAIPDSTYLCTCYNADMCTSSGFFRFTMNHFGIAFRANHFVSGRFGPGVAHVGGCRVLKYTHQLEPVFVFFFVFSARRFCLILYEFQDIKALLGRGGIHFPMAHYVESMAHTRMRRKLA